MQRAKQNKLFFRLTEQEMGRGKALRFIVLRIISSMGISVGAAGILFALGGIEVFPGLFLIAAIVALAVFVLDWSAKGKMYGEGFCLAAAAIVFALSVSRILRVSAVWGNAFCHLWNRMFGTFFAERLTLGCTKEDLLAGGVVFILLMTAMTGEFLQRKRILALSLAVFIPICLGLLLSVSLPGWAVAMAVGGWLAAWCSVSGDLGIRWEMAVIIAVIGVSLLIWPSFGPVFGWQRAAGQFQAWVRQEVKRLRFGEDTLPEGDLFKAGDMLAGEKDCLELTMEEPSPVYLRGFVGSVFQENQWEPLPASDYSGEFLGMLSWLSRQGFYPGSQYSAYLEAGGENAEREVKVSVKNLGANRRYIYLPGTVSVYSEPAKNWKQDWSMESSGWFGQDGYSFSYVNVQNNAEVQMPAPWIYQSGAGTEAMENFKEAERVYRSFVYEHYLKLEEEQEHLLNETFFQGGSQEETRGLYAVTSRIRAVLRILADYQSAPAKLPARRDFLSWFLQEEKEGNAAYYASAAVLAYRAAGIPARYAEGYLLTKKQAEQISGNQVVLTSQNAHAWVEVYVDGMGWRVMEVTPGFYEEIYQAEIIMAVPKENVEGAGDGTSGMLSSEEYEYPEQEEEHHVPPARRNTAAGVLLMSVLAAILLWGILRRSWILYMHYRYQRMDGREKMYFLYQKMMHMLGKLYQDFNPQHPMKLREQGEIPLDMELYERMVRRMERIIYGQMEPAAREIPSAEELFTQVRVMFFRRRRWRKLQKYLKICWNNKKGAVLK